MNKKLVEVFENLIDLMQNQQGILGAWHFGSVARNMDDDFSDYDVVFLVEENYFNKISIDIISFIKKACDNVILEWTESFNSDAIVNNGYIIEHKKELFQFDIFLLNQSKLDDFMCKIHYAEITPNAIIFDKDGTVLRLCDTKQAQETWNDDVSKLVSTYWFHAHMSTKYLYRQDFFKLNEVLRVMMDTHISLMLTGYDKTCWGGYANKLKFISSEKQMHLKKYGCIDDFLKVKDNIKQSMIWFLEDTAQITKFKNNPDDDTIGNTIYNQWLNSNGY